MYTYQMVGLADCNDRTYECEFGTYNKENGFMFNESTQQQLDDQQYLGENVKGFVLNLIDELFHNDMWKMVKEPEPKKMTLADIEKELGYRIQVVDPELDKPTDKKKELTEEEKEDIDETIQFFKDLFGIKLDPKKYK